MKKPKMNTPEEREAHYQKLCKLRDAASKARDRFQDALEKSKGGFELEVGQMDPNWVKLCEEHQMVPDSTYGDWMC